MKRIMIILCGLLYGMNAQCRSQSEPIGSAEFYWLMNRACYYGDDLSVQMLLNAGADPGGQNYEAFVKKYNKPFEPSWPINQAADNGHAKVIRLLLSAGANPNATEGGGQTALIIATERGDSEIVKLLLDSGADKTYKGVDGRGVPGTAEEIANRHGYKNIEEMIRSFHSPKTNH